MNEQLDVLSSPAVQAHIAMLQGIINRMAGNSANCKNWTITLVAAMLVLLVDKNMHLPNAWLCLIPVGLFYLLDCYYLGLERMTIDIQKNFLKKISENEGYINQIYKVEALGDQCVQLCNTLKAMLSLSTTPFYLIVALVILLFGKII